MEEVRYDQSQQPKMIAGRRPAGARRPAPRGDAASTIFVANVAEKRYVWTARAVAVITALSLCCNIVLLLAIFQLVPLYRVEPFLLTFHNRADQVYDIQPITSELRNRKSITEVFVRDYVLQRNSFTRNADTAMARWDVGGPVQESSSQAVYQKFRNEVMGEALSLIRQKGLERKVKILSVSEIADNIWQVEYQTEDTYPDSAQPEVRYFTASMKVGYRRKKVAYGERLKNPLGFTVIEYATGGGRL